MHWGWVGPWFRTRPPAGARADPLPLPGLFAFYVASGVAILASRRLPAWIGWVGLVLGVASVTPAAIAGFFGLVLWPPVVGILTYLRSSRPETAGAVVEPAPA